MTTMWRSKLGNEFPKEEIDRDEKKHKADLDRLRKLPANRNCADCGDYGTHWASVNLGVFLCMSCGAHHVGMGTHVSLPKECCTGAYLWGPDEVQRLADMGNAKAVQIYGGLAERPLKTAPHWQWRQYIVDKYEHKKFVPKRTKRPVKHAQTPNAQNPVQHQPVVSSPQRKEGLKILPASAVSPQKKNSENKYLLEGDGASSPKGVVLRPARHVSPSILKSPHHPPNLGGHAIVRVMAHADSMDFESDEDLTPSSRKVSLEKRNEKDSSLSSPALQRNEMSDNFFHDMGL